MTPEDIDRVQKTVGVTLPESYKRVLRAFPVPAYKGNADIAVWDNADRLIEYNLELRRGAPGGVKPWPSHFFAIGHAGDGCPQALDLRAGDAVWWVEHCHLDSENSQKEADSFEAWAGKYFADLREEMVGEEVDPDAGPEDRIARDRKSTRETTLGCLAVALVVGIVVLLIRLWLRG